MYTFAVYGLLLVWRIYDWWQLVEEDTTSMWHFFKWAFVDLVFMFGVPALRIPWLEWSDTTSIVAYVVHAALNGMLMFRIPVSWQSQFFAVSLLTLTEAPHRRMATVLRKDCI